MWESNTYKCIISEIYKLETFAVRNEETIFNLTRSDFDLRRFEFFFLEMHQSLQMGSHLYLLPGQTVASTKLEYRHLLAHAKHGVT